MSGVSPGVIASGSEVVDQILRELDGLGRLVVRVAPTSSTIFALSLRHAMKDRPSPVQVVTDPTLQPGQAVWMRPFTVPWDVILVLAGSEDEALEWAGTRGLPYGLHRDATSVFGTWEPDGLERMRAEYHGPGVAAVVLPGWGARFGDPGRLDVEMLLHPGWTPGVPDGYGPPDGATRRMNVESELLGVVSRFGGQTIVAGEPMQQMVAELAEVVDQLAREGWLPKAERVASVPLWAAGS